jgi:hypothetical protein
LRLFLELPCDEDKVAVADFIINSYNQQKIYLSLFYWLSFGTVLLLYQAFSFQMIYISSNFSRALDDGLALAAQSWASCFLHDIL